MSAYHAGKPQVLLFDVNETLLDLTPLKNQIDDLLLLENGSVLWFSTMLHHSLVLSASGQYKSFTDVGAACLQMVARNQDIALEEAEAARIVGSLRSMPVHTDVVAALEQLKQAGFQMAALSNSGQTGLEAQLKNAGIDGFFAKALSVEHVGKFKPHHEVYQWAAREMDVGIERCMLVAAHGWDVAGAKWAGMRTAFVERPGQHLFPLAPLPDIHVAQLSELYNELGSASASV